MMRALFRALVVASCVAGAADVAAAPVSFAFTSVPLVQFAQFTYRDLLHRDYVLSAELVDMNKRVTVNVKALDESKVVSFVEGILRSQGIRSTQRDGVFFLEAAGASLPDAKPDAATAAGSVPEGLHPAPSDGRPGVPDGPAVAAPVEYMVVQAFNRSTEFLITAINAAAGSNVARPGGGSRVVLASPKERLHALADLVKQLDVAADVVEVSASFVEVTTNEAGASGLALVNSALSAGSALSNGVSVVPAQGQITVRGGRYQLVLDALASDGRFKQVSNSRVVGDDAEKLLLSVGDETPTLGSSSTDNQGNRIQNVVYRPSGVILDVLPHVLGSGRLSLVVDGQVSSFQSTTTGVANSPTLVKRQVKTSVSIRDGDVVVIGGLNDAKATASTAGFSFLPAGWRTKSRQDTKTDLVLILSARVLQGVKRDDT